MFRRVVLLAFAVLLASLPASAQFYTDGNEPAGVRWRRIDTPDYKVIYPEGLDSLARVYARTLERVKLPVGATAGYIPNETSRRPLPVILHPWTAHANGMVTWTPRRMELFTTPDFLDPLSSPWEEHLVTHESRHVAQMQFTADPVYKVWNLAFGQLFAGAAAVIYCGPSFYEGDAVAAETALTPSGRGRNAAFLEYYRSAFREGDTRDWWQWRYGSLRNYTPDYYTIGYITAAGMQDVFGAPDFTARYYERIFRHPKWPWPLFNYNKTVKEVTGKKFRAAFPEICDTLQARWNRDEAARAPFMPAVQIVPEDRHYVDYSGNCWLGGTMYTLRSGTARIRQLRTPSGRGVSPFGYMTSQLKASPDYLSRIYWSEIIRDPRWEMKSYSEVWYTGHDGRKHRLKARTRWYNPAPDGTGRLAVTEYPVFGGSRLLVVSEDDGSEICSYDAPDGMQLVEAEWGGDGALYVSAVTSEGAGIYRADTGFSKVLGCGYAALKGLFSHKGDVYFVSDLNGVDELYRLDAAAGEAWRITSTVQGGGSFRFSPASDTLVYSAVTPRGRFLYATPVDSLPAPVRADFGVPHQYELAPPPAEPALDFPADSIGPSRPYNRLAGLFRVHSWVPLYVDYDAVESLSFESVASSAGLGATAFFQNELNTMYGTAAYNAGYSDTHWNHKVEAKFTYSGLYPVIEAGASLQTEAPSHYYLFRRFGNFAYYQSLNSEQIEGLPSFNAHLKMYLPLNFSSGGWFRGVVPQVQWNVSNGILTMGGTAPMNRVSASVRAYAVTASPTSCIYPKFGMGAELGWSGRPGATGLFAPNTYVYTYGYLPGLMDTHGLRYTYTLQRPLSNGSLFRERYAAVMPRGMVEYGELASSAAYSPLQSRLTLDYAFPFAPLDWSGLGNIAYVRNLECILHGDWSYMAGTFAKQYASVGADLTVVLGNFLWVPYDTKVGISCYYNFGAPEGFRPYFVDAVFSVSF